MKPARAYCYSRCEGCRLGFLTPRGSLGAHRIRLILAGWTPPSPDREHGRWTCPRGCDAGVLLRVETADLPASEVEIRALWRAFNSPHPAGIRAPRTPRNGNLPDGTRGEM
jgi:hypothetical protein